MATTSSTIVMSSASNSLAKSTLKPISDMLNALVTAGVLTKTADTGQVSWGSVNETDISINAYEIFTLNDSLHVTAPVYIKILYKSSATNTQSPYHQVQIGTGSDGAGNLTGGSAAAQFRCPTQANTTYDGTARPCYASAGEGYLTVFGGWNSTAGLNSQGGFALVIDRLRDSSGNALADGLAVLGSFHQISSQSVTPAGGGSTRSLTGVVVAACFGATFAAGLANLFSASNMQSPPVMSRGAALTSLPQFDGVNFLAVGIQPYAGKIYPAMLGALMADDNFPQNSTMTLNVYGANHTYFIGSNNTPFLTPGYANPAVNTAMNAISVGNYLLTGGLPILRYE